MTEDIYQTIKSILAESRGDRYEKIAREIGGAAPHLLVNYEGGQERVEVVLKKEKERHEKITAALEWLESVKGSEVNDATKERIEPGNSLLEHQGDDEIRVSAKTSGSSLAIDSSQERKEN